MSSTERSSLLAGDATQSEDISSTNASVGSSRDSTRESVLSSMQRPPSRHLQHSFTMDYGTAGRLRSRMIQQQQQSQQGHRRTGSYQIPRHLTSIPSMSSASDDADSLRYSVDGLATPEDPQPQYGFGWSNPLWSCCFRRKEPPRPIVSNEEFYNIGPWKRWYLYGIFPWKLLMLVTLVGLFTLELKLSDWDLFYQGDMKESIHRTLVTRDERFDFKENKDLSISYHNAHELLRDIQDIVNNYYTMDKGSMGMMTLQSTATEPRIPPQIIISRYNTTKQDIITQRETFKTAGTLQEVYNVSHAYPLGDIPVCENKNPTVIKKTKQEQKLLRKEVKKELKAEFRRQKLMEKSADNEAGNEASPKESAADHVYVPEGALEGQCSPGNDYELTRNFFATLISLTLRVNVYTLSANPSQGLECFRWVILFNYHFSPHRAKMILHTTDEVAYCEGYHFINNFVSLDIAVCTVAGLLILLTLNDMWKPLLLSYLYAHENPTFARRSLRSKLRFALKIPGSHDSRFVNLLLLCGAMSTLVFTIVKSHIGDGKMHTQSSSGRVWMGVALFLNYVSLSHYLVKICFPEHFQIVLTTIGSAMPQVCRMAVALLPIFAGYMVVGNIMFGSYSNRFSTMGNAFITLFSNINGDEIRETANSIDSTDPFARIVSRLYIVSFIIIFIYGVLSITIAIVEKAYKHSHRKMAPPQQKKFIEPTTPGVEGHRIEDHVSHFRRNSSLASSLSSNTVSGSVLRKAFSRRSESSASSDPIPGILSSYSFQMQPQPSLSPALNHSPSDRASLRSVDEEKQLTAEEGDTHTSPADSGPSPSFFSVYSQRDEDEGSRPRDSRQRTIDSELAYFSPVTSRSNGSNSNHQHSPTESDRGTNGTGRAMSVSFSMDTKKGKRGGNGR